MSESVEKGVVISKDASGGVLSVGMAGGDDGTVGMDLGEGGVEVFLFGLCKESLLMAKATPGILPLARLVTGVSDI